MSLKDAGTGACLDKKQDMNLAVSLSYNAFLSEYKNSPLAFGRGIRHPPKHSECFSTSETGGGATAVYVPVD